MEKLNQLNEKLNIRIDENEIIDDFDDEKEMINQYKNLIKIEMMTPDFKAICTDLIDIHLIEVHQMIHKIITIWQWKPFILTMKQG
ncbi:MAG: hypothetical protein J6A89_08810 [Clostridia bacterium]|nr:hypothetical protein [Clostridia bacterium]